MVRRIRSKNKSIHALNWNVIKKGCRNQICRKEKNTDIVVRKPFYIRKMNRIHFLFILFPLLFISCAEEKKYIWKSRVVKVSAYNSTIAQTDGLPTLAAWSDTLVPGMKAVAVSRDLIALGLDHNTQVKIEGLDGVFLVKDKMASRMRNKIDIYMGRDVEKAREWGTQTLKIQYRIKRDSARTTE